MIYFTTFIFTLLLAHNARAVPACGDVASPQGLYDMYDDEQLVFAGDNVTWDAMYDNPNGNTNSVVCGNGPHGLAAKYPHFHDFPDFPYLGGAFNVKWGSSNCGECWKLTDTKTHKFIYLTAIDTSKRGFGLVISKHAFMALSGGPVVPPTLEVESVPVPRHFCGFKS
jgi:hypothetical protein